MRVVDGLIGGYIFFWGDDDIYSNFYPAPCTDPQLGIKVPTSEHLFMSYKALEFGDYDTFEDVLKVDRPYGAKKLGRGVVGFDDEAWTKVRYDRMLRACLFKFSQNESLKEQLLATGDYELVEASPYDKVWGIGLAEDDPNVCDKSKWKGENLLGKVLMEVRGILRNSIERK